MRVSKLAVGVTAVAGVLSLGVAAFALDGGTGTDEGTVTEPTVTTAPTTTLAPGEDTGTTDPTETTEPAGTTDSTTGVSTEGCPEGETYANHGAYVRSVAHDPDRAPGDQAAAAQSDCGKPLAATEPADDTDATEPTEPTESTEPADTDSGPPAAPGGQTGAPGNSGNAPGRNK